MHKDDMLRSNSFSDPSIEFLITPQFLEFPTLLKPCFNWISIFLPTLISRENNYPEECSIIYCFYFLYISLIYMKNNVKSDEVECIFHFVFKKTTNVVPF